MRPKINVNTLLEGDPNAAVAPDQTDPGVLETQSDVGVGLPDQPVEYNPETIGSLGTNLPAPPVPVPDTTTPPPTLPPPDGVTTQPVVPAVEDTLPPPPPPGPVPNVPDQVDTPLAPPPLTATGLPTFKVGGGVSKALRTPTFRNDRIVGGGGRDLLLNGISSRFDAGTPVAPTPLPSGFSGDQTSPGQFSDEDLLKAIKGRGRR